MSNCLSLNIQEWMTDLNLRMCTHQERGVWLDILCLMHKSDRPGVLNWALPQIAQAAGSDVDTVIGLARKGVLRGKSASDTASIHTRTDLPLTFAATHARKKGEEVVLIEDRVGDVWYCDWMVIGAHKRKTASVAAKSVGVETGVSLRGQARAVGRSEQDGALGGRQDDAVGSAGERAVEGPEAPDFALSGEPAEAGVKRSKLARGPECPYERLIEGFLARFPNAPRPRAVSSGTRLGKAILGMWRTQGAGKDEEFSGYATVDQGLEKWGRIFDLAKKSRFLRGEAAPRENGAPFRISMDWFMTAKQVERVLNGFYDRSEPSRSIATGVQESAVRVAELLARRTGAGPVQGQAPAQGTIF